jgi:hypothetical protein
MSKSVKSNLNTSDLDNFNPLTPPKIREPTKVCSYQIFKTSVKNKGGVHKSVKSIFSIANLDLNDPKPKSIQGISHQIC